MNKFSIIIFCLLAMATFAMGVNDAEARSSFWDANCATCHAAETASCAGCHAHGVHSGSSKTDINVSASTDKATYTPGETVTVSITGGYRDGWVRAILYNENGVEVDRSEGPGCGTGGPDNGCGDGEEFYGPIFLTAPAPSTPGSYLWEASWYGNQYDLEEVGGTTFFGLGWRPDPNNPNHGEEIVFTNPFDVMATGECGDGILDPAEFCDDGNNDPGDCCAADCTYETGGSACGDPSNTQCDNPDTCDGAGLCESNFVPPDTLCDDGLFCNVDETCDGTGVCGAGAPLDYGDGVGCTDDSCDETNDVVVNVPNDGLCDNGEFCDGSETCDAVDDCQAGTPPVVDDGVGCTDDSCDENNDAVVNVPNDGLCDNGQFCDGSETCDAVDDCQAGTLPCDPASESCDEVGDICEPIGCQSDAECDNGLFCDGSETCDLGGICQPGTPVNPDDGVSCTVDSCDEANGIVNAPNDGLCDDGAFCNGSETCDAANDCQPGTPVNPDDGVGCTDDSCDEANGVVNAPNDGLCDNGEFCDGSETCDAVDDCQPGTPPCDSNTETCDDVGDVCEPIPVEVDLDLISLKPTKKVSLTRVKPVVLKLVVKNEGTVEGSALATITGMQNEVEVYNETLTVTDVVGNGRTTYNDASVPAIPPFVPTVAGDILWTVTMVDGDPDMDEIMAVTIVTP
jgi:hypothetical protein